MSNLVKNNFSFKILLSLGFFSALILTLNLFLTEKMISISGYLISLLVANCLAWFRVFEKKSFSSYHANEKRWIFLALAITVITINYNLYGFADNHFFYYFIFNIADVMFLALTISFVNERKHFITREMVVDGIIVFLSLLALFSALYYHSLVSLYNNEPFNGFLLLEMKSLILYLVLGTAMFVVAGSIGTENNLGMLFISAAFFLNSFVAFLFLEGVSITGDYHIEKSSNIDLITLFTAVNMIVFSMGGWLDKPLTFLEKRESHLVLPIILSVSNIILLFVAQWQKISLISSVSAMLALGFVLLRMTININHKKQALSKSENRALTDTLTGLKNRRQLSHDLKKIIENNSPYTLFLFDLDGFKHYNDTFGHPAGDELLKMLGSRLKESLNNSSIAYRLGGDEFCALCPNTEKEQVLLATTEALKEAGQGFSISASWGEINLHFEAQNPEQAMLLVDQRMYMNKNSRRSKLNHEEAYRALLAAFRAKNNKITLNDLSDLAVEVAKEIGCPESEMNTIFYASKLHDIGKIAIPDNILDKQQSLNEEEWNMMKQHSIIGQTIVSSIPSLEKSALIIRSSHEHYDGTGYPDNLKGEQIPLYSRIIHVCDAYYAMITDKPYRKAFSQQKTIEKLVEQSGKQFDPEIVEAFEKVILKRNNKQKAA